MVLKHIRNKRINILANIVDLSINVKQSSIIFIYVLVFGQLLIFIFLLIIFNSSHSYSFAAHLHVKVNRAGELIQRRFYSILSHHFTYDSLCHLFVDIQELTDLLERNVKINFWKNYDVVLEKSFLENAVTILAPNFLMLF